jgi:glutamyl-tRNA synthetase
MLRFPFSPTGDIHIGNLRVAVLNYIVAKQRGERFIVRIEDTDKEQNIEGKDEEIMMILEKFAIIHDQRVDQSENLHIHQTLAIRLLEEKKAFISLSTQEATKNHHTTLESGELARLREEKIPFVVRLKNPTDSITFTDTIKGEIATDLDEVGSFAILDSNGRPSDDFASACDDILGGIDMIVCDEGGMVHTMRQIHIKNILGYETHTSYAHLPTLQSDNDSDSIRWLFEQGFLPDAILNYLIALGSDTPKEIFTLPEAMEWFDLTQISPSPVKFDIDRLRFINREHLRMMDDKKLSSIFGFADSDIGKLVKCFLVDASTIGELEPKIKAIFSPKEMGGAWGEEMGILADIIALAKPFGEYQAFKEHLIAQSGLTNESLEMPLRLLLTGREDGPKLSEIYPFIKSYILEIAS